MVTGIDNEELLMEVRQGSIYPLDLAALVDLAEYLKVTKTKYEGKSQLAVTKLLCNFLEEKMAERESVEENATFLLDVKSFILRKSPLLEGDGKKVVKLKAAEKKFKEMRESFEALMLEKKAELEKATGEVKWLGGETEKEQKKSGENEKPQVSPQINFQNSLLRCDFKIIG